MKRLFAATAAMLALVALGACDDGDDESKSNDQDDSTSAAVNEACKLFTEQDAEDVLGVAVEKETDLGGTEATSCSYVAADDPTRVLGLGVGDFDTEEDAEKAILRARADAQFDGLEVRDVDGIGDEAYYLSASNNFERTINDEQLTFGELTARDGTRVVTAFMTPESEDAGTAIVGRALD